ncbi:hypothetical protein [Alkalilacustris brevis]|uniref:hypothetical protein n=1 Tax=Alkalilacustris brevis TaxID=2026338 RepID=UPI001EE3B98F|nr:hypothetical protein [Alkalilacustris brevis]
MMWIFGMPCWAAKWAEPDFWSGIRRFHEHGIDPTLAVVFASPIRLIQNDAIETDLGLPPRNIFARGTGKTASAKGGDLQISTAAATRGATGRLTQVSAAREGSVMLRCTSRGDGGSGVRVIFRHKPASGPNRK